ncbi:MAG TPA: glycosyltransferase [Anaerolineaceae bacterium]|nr:glycosyltransferase [Anaerolineaceae bacterium]HPN50789.1 glycosyltransferase [Anaerolineaceae bacterium]
MNNSIRIIILTADTGYGHRSVARAIASALEERYEARCEAKIVNPLDYPSAPSFIRRSQVNYDKVVRQAPFWHEFNYGLSENFLVRPLYGQVMGWMLARTLRDVIQKEKPDVIITTCMIYQMALQQAMMLEGVRIPLVTVVTDLARVHSMWFRGQITRCVVPNLRVYRQAVKSGLHVRQVVQAGIPVHPDIARRCDDPRGLRANLGWDETGVVGLVVSSKRVRGMKETLAAICKANLPLRLAVVTGGDDELLAAVEQMDWQVKPYLYGKVEDMSNLFHAANLVISKAGGLIISESLACGLPLLMMDALPGQEIGNVEYVTHRGAGEFTPQPEKLVETLRAWLADDGKLLKFRIGKARELGRPWSAYQVADLAWESAWEEQEELVWAH